MYVVIRCLNVGNALLRIYVLNVDIKGFLILLIKNKKNTRGCSKINFCARKTEFQTKITQSKGVPSVEDSEDNT